MNIKKNIDYSELFTQISKVVESNLDQMQLYAEIGRYVALRTEKGAAVAAAEYLSKMYPEKAGFSPRNVRRMRDFYLAYKDHPQMMSLALQLNWTQNVVILETCNEATREWYMRSAKQNAWTKSELMAAIENEAHQGTPVDNSEKVCYSDTSNLEEKNSDEVVVCKPREHMQKSHGGDYANKMHLLLDFTEAPGNIGSMVYRELCADVDAGSSWLQRTA